MVHIVELGIPRSPSAFYLIDGDDTILVVVLLLVHEIEGCSDSGIDIARSSGLRLGLASLLGAVALDGDDALAIAFKDEGDAEKCEEYDSDCHASHTNAIRVGVFDTLRLLGLVIVERLGGGKGHVGQAVLEGDEIDVVTNGILAHDDNLTIGAIETEGVVGATEIDAVDQIAIHVEDTEIGGVVISGGEEDNIFALDLNALGAENVGQVVTFFERVGDIVSHFLKTFVGGAENVDSTVDRVDHRIDAGVGSIARLDGDEVDGLRSRATLMHIGLGGRILLRLNCGLVLSHCGSAHEHDAEETCQ